MNNIPAAAEYYYQHTYYQFGEHYARYYSRGLWRDSASVTNEELILSGVKITERYKMTLDQLKRRYNTTVKQRDENHFELVDAYTRIEMLESLLFKASEQIYDQPELEQEIMDALD